MTIEERVKRELVNAYATLGGRGLAYHGVHTLVWIVLNDRPAIAYIDLQWQHPENVIIRTIADRDGVKLAASSTKSWQGLYEVAKIVHRRFE